MNLRTLRINAVLAILVWVGFVYGANNAFAQPVDQKTPGMIAKETRSSLAAKMGCPEEGFVSITTTDDGSVLSMFVRSKEIFVYGRTFQVSQPGVWSFFRPHSAPLPNDGKHVFVVRQPKPKEDPCWELFAIQ